VNYALKENPMTVISGNPWSLRRALYGLLAGGLLSASAAALIALPMASTANAQCDQTVGNSIDSYLQRHPDLHQELEARSQAEGGGPNVLDYLSRHPDVRQHLIDLSQQCTD
jgi:hypothetical protein